MNAIAAMSLNRVIGRGGQLPWHLPEDFRWFKKTTSGGVVLMGRKTFDSLGKPLPKRTNVVVTRGEAISGVETIADLADFNPEVYAPREVWVIGGAEIFRQLLPKCRELLLTVVQRDYDGDVLFPEFEPDFTYVETPLRTPDFEVRRYRNRAFPAAIG